MLKEGGKKIVSHLILYLLSAVLLIFFQTSAAQHCNLPFTVNYSCLDNAGHLVGYVAFQTKNITGVCLPDFPDTMTEICQQITNECNRPNNSFSALCNGKCTAGDASSSQMNSCKGVY